jgi:hypothetical protein
MGRDTSANFRRGAFASETSEAYIILVQLDHTALEEPIRITTDPMTEFSPGIYGVMSNGEQFTALPFEIVLPGQAPNSPPVSTLKMDNISREIALAVRRMNSAADATISVVLASDPDVTEILIEGFQLNNIRLDALIVEGELNLERTDLTQFPPQKMTPSYFRGLH